MLDLQVEVCMYWDSLKKLIENHKIVIDRPKGTNHPKYSNFIYPIDYGYLEGTTAVDGNEIDIFVGSSSDSKIQGIICTVDLLKNDAEIKIMYKCTEEEIQIALELLNSKYMSGIFVKNTKEE